MFVKVALATTDCADDAVRWLTVENGDVVMAVRDYRDVFRRCFPHLEPTTVRNYLRYCGLRSFASWTRPSDDLEIWDPLQQYVIAVGKPRTKVRTDVALPERYQHRPRPRPCRAPPEPPSPPLPDCELETVTYPDGTRYYCRVVGHNADGSVELEVFDGIAITDGDPAAALSWAPANNNRRTAVVPAAVAWVSDDAAVDLFSGPWALYE